MNSKTPLPDCFRVTLTVARPDWGTHLTLPIATPIAKALEGRLGQGGCCAARPDLNNPLTCWRSPRTRRPGASR